MECYTKIYDVVSKAIRKVSPKTKFVALALADRNPAWISYFLNDSNHAAGFIEPEYISYHFYAWGRRENIKAFSSFFDQADDFFEQVAAIERIRRQLKPSLKTTLNEIGVILDGDPVGGPIPQAYWAAASALCV